MSSATLATCQAPVLFVTWYAKTRAKLGNRQYPGSELPTPHGTAHLKLKTSASGEAASEAMG